MGRIRKISVCGKGGSGKSIITTLLANGIKEQGYRVLVVDSDESNSGLYRMLGFSYPPTPLLELAGGKKSVKRAMKSKFSEGREEPEINVLAQKRIRMDEIPAQYIISSNNISLVNIGKILQFLEGCACPMGVLSREFLSRLSLDDKEIAIVDMEAGVEHFGRGVEEGIDSLLIVTEASFESLYLAEKIAHL
ncbi:MAG: P-loop NTPase, partial [bacterium]